MSSSSSRYKIIKNVSWYKFVAIIYQQPNYQSVLNIYKSIIIKFLIVLISTISTISIIVLIKYIEIRKLI